MIWYSVYEIGASSYIVFLSLTGIGVDSTSGYFTVFPGLSGGGHSGGMYPVVGGIVIDPHDDFGIGASSGLTVAVWKARLRALIAGIITL